jgi:hypothetical protein
VNLCNTQNTSVSIITHRVNESEVTVSQSFSTETSTTQNLPSLQKLNPPAEAHCHSHSINMPSDLMFCWPCILLRFSVNDQLDTQFFSMYSFLLSTCFEQPRAHHQENQLYQYNKYQMLCWSQKSRVLRRRYIAAHLQRLWVRIPPGAWMFVCCECCVLSDSGFCAELITRPEESYQLWCVVVCDLETSWMRRHWPTGGLLCQKQTNKQTRCCIDIIDSPDDEHEVARNMYRIEINT